MLPLFAAAMLAASTPSPVLETAVPWWERITVTVDDQGKQHLCQYQISLSPSGSQRCDEAMAASMSVRPSDHNGLYSKMTFERRFSPGARLDTGRLQPGDELLGRQVMFLTFDAAGAIRSCEVIAKSGEMAFQYGCDEARKEQFRAEAATSPVPRQAFMTILAYGHMEQIA